MADTTMTVTVVTAVPLTVIADGSVTACPAAVTDAATYTAGDRVQVTVRDPQMPLVTGKVDS